MRRGDWGYSHFTYMNSTVFVNPIYLFILFIFFFFFIQNVKKTCNRRGDWGCLHITCMNLTVFVNQFIYLKCG